MADVKMLYHNMLQTERFIDMLAVNPNKLKNHVMSKILYIKALLSPKI
jgi:hypothetical protein